MSVFTSTKLFIKYLHIYAVIANKNSWSANKKHTSTHIFNAFMFYFSEYSTTNVLQQSKNHRAWIV